MEDVLALCERPMLEREPVACVNEKPVVRMAVTRGPAFRLQMWIQLARPRSIGRKDWLHFGRRGWSQGRCNILCRRELPKAGYPDSPVSGRRVARPRRQLCPGVGRLTPTAYAAKMAK